MNKPKYEIFYDTIMTFFVHNGFLITVIDMFFTHAALLLIYYLADIPPMISFNIVSVAIYLFCILMYKYEHHILIYFCILLEVSTYAIFGTYYVGWQSGTVFFLCAIVPVIIYFGYILLKKYYKTIIALLLITNFTLYVTLYIKFKHVMPIYQVPIFLNDCLVVLSSFTMVFSTIFYNCVYIFSMKLKTNKLKSDNKQLKYEASRDNLTGWLNRNSFMPLIIKHSDSTQESLSIAFIDIDNFKKVNDTYGHDCGDEVLKRITKLIKNNLGDDGIYCRWGGEELVVALKNYDLHNAADAMDTIRSAIADTSTVFYNKHVNVTISVGVAEYLRNDVDSSSVQEQIASTITLADERMYKGKQSSKNIVVSE